MSVKLLGRDGFPFDPTNAKHLSSTVGGRLRSTLQAIFSGNYVAGGDTLDFTGAAGGGANVVPPGIADISELIKVNVLNVGVAGQFLSLAGTPIVIVGSTLKNWKIKLFGTAFGAEIAAGAYAANITGEIFLIEVEWQIGLV